MGLNVGWWGSTEKKKVSYLHGLRGRHGYSDQRSSQNRAPSVVFIVVGSEGKEDKMIRSSA